MAKPYEPPTVTELGTFGARYDIQCDTNACTAIATAVAHWPGESRRFCEPCAKRALHIATAMGFKLSVSPL